MAKRNNKKKTKFGIWGWLIAGLLLIGGGFGVTQSGLLGDGEDNNNKSANTTPQEPVNTDNGTEDHKHVNITISQSDILWDNEAVTSDEVVTRVSEEDGSTTYTVTDDSAIKATYDEVINALNENQVEFEEAEQQV
ncbi:hypothetical protein HYQ40_01025 [Aerococcaceae bacterium DSM 111021]|nr:hypothetical protein [Aerococcaceae bacterium DSM 111021]